MMFRLSIVVVVGLAGANLSAQEKPRTGAVKNPALRDELLKRIVPDQQVRSELIAWMKKNRMPQKAKKNSFAEFGKIVARMKKIDAENTRWLKSTVDKHGWPTVSMVGDTGARAAWLLVQHADADRKFQRRCLDLMTALPKEEVSLANVAYLTDRVLLAEGKKQRYGTQFIQVNGQFEPKPLEDPKNVDRFRAAAGLPSLAEYKKLIRRQYEQSKRRQQPPAKP